MTQRQYNSYTIFGDRIANALNKYMFALWNSHATRSIEVRRITLFAQQVTAVAAPVIMDLELKYIITTLPAGTDLTILSRNAGESAPSDIVAKTLATNVTDSSIVKRWLMYSEEQAVAAPTLLLKNAQDTLLFEAAIDEIGIVLPPSKGLALKHITNDALSSLSFQIDFRINR